MEESPNYSSESYIPFLADNGQVPEAGSTHVREGNDFGHQRKYKDILKTCCDVSFADAPWRRVSRYSFGIIGLHEEVNDFYETMRPKEQETELRLKVIEHITRVVHSLWPQAQVEIFGSFRTGLYLPSSDLDMVIFGEWKSLPLSTLSQALENNGILNSDINVIANATVPIIRLVHSPSGIRVDISFNMANGVESAKLVKKMMKQHPALPKLVLILKQFLIHRGLNEVYNGGMSSYCLTLLIVSFLQGYHKPNFEPSANFGAALLEFFEHYGVNFNYDKVSIHFQSGGLYKPRRTGGNLLSVEDPLVSGHDVAKGTYLMNLLKMSFQNAFYLLSKAVTESLITKTPVVSFLHLIVKVDPQVITNRELMQSNHPKLMKKLSKLIDKLNEDQPVESASTSTPRSTPKNFHKKKKFGPIDCTHVAMGLMQWMGSRYQLTVNSQ
ncbi:unnamed protein product [Larinioides sclopetarius]|uniref:polynucleotide adenylyltransferase n=1 Tax=Larinioides sclopetarius TaxID=280406 RepID=A0AAV2BFW6_9ARAC